MHPASITARRAAVAVGVLLTLGIGILHLDYHRAAGALWRDEVNSVNVASLPTAAEVYAHMRYDSFPPAWIGLVYAWRSTGLAGDGDAGYRRLGLAVGLAMLAVVWWTGWQLGVGPPLVMLLLFGLSPSVIIYGDAVRGYGLAALAVLWSAGAIWAFVDRPTWRRYAVAQVAAIVAAQTHFGNGIPLLGIGVGAAAVCWRRHDVRRLLAALGIGAVAAAVLFVVNYPILRYMMQTGPQEQHSAVTLGRVVSVFSASLAPNLPILAAAWALSAGLAAIGLATALLWRRDQGDADRAVFAILALAIGLGGTLPAYMRTSVPTNHWHYLSVIGLSALACEVGVWALLRRTRYGAWARVAGVATVALLTFPAAVESVRLRMTSVDLAAAAIEQAARRGDLVVVFPWVAGITFDRYYRGPAPWITLPDLPDHRFHLHLHVRQRMELGERGIAAELARVEQTLRAGGRVWIVGQPVAPDPGAPLPALGRPSDRGSAGRHLDHWEQQFGRLLETHAGEGRRVPLPDVGAVNAWENLPLFVAEGWR